MAMKKSELRELYLMMFPEYPDIVNITQLQSMLGISRHLAYDLINDGYIRGLKIGNAFRIPKVNVIEYVMDQGICGNNRHWRTDVNSSCGLSILRNLHREGLWRKSAEAGQCRPSLTCPNGDGP